MEPFQQQIYNIFAESKLPEIQRVLLKGGIPQFYHREKVFEVASPEWKEGSHGAKWVYMFALNETSSFGDWIRLSRVEDLSLGQVKVAIQVAKEIAKNGIVKPWPV